MDEATCGCLTRVKRFPGENARNGRGTKLFTTCAGSPVCHRSFCAHMLKSLVGGSPSPPPRPVK
ncbi:hypothetical protein JOB18_008891 [Solea senegalensis]|nr:hypothetical protein JOB18_008891 [Solea senegalensis]